MKITIAGTGYVGLSNAMLLAQHNQVIAIDIVPEKVALLNAKKSPIEDAEIEDFLHNKQLNFTATIRQLAELVIELIGSKSKLVFMPLPADDPMQRKPDITLAKAHLGWQPTVQLREGLGQTIAYFDKLLGVDQG